jgi:hypothetical protein
MSVTSDDGQLTANIMDHEPVHAPGSWSHLRSPEQIVPEAFDGLPLSVPRQLATATGTDLKQVLETLGGICKGTPAIADLREYAKRTRVAFYLYVGGQISETVPSEESDHHKVAIVVATWCGQYYFYKGMGTHARADTQRLRAPLPDAPP